MHFVFLYCTVVPIPPADPIDQSVQDGGIIFDSPDQPMWPAERAIAQDARQAAPQLPPLPPPGPPIPPPPQPLPLPPVVPPAVVYDLCKVPHPLLEEQRPALQLLLMPLVQNILRVPARRPLLIED